jgi:serine/threonine protein kinase
MLLERGLVIGGRYRLERSVGAGGMGEVWAALDSRTNEIVAIKALLESARRDPELVRRFVREARAAIAVQHPNVVRIRETLTVGEEPILVMDYLEGESLARRLRSAGKLSLSRFAELFVAVVSAVETAHGLGIVHRDLKPDNVFLVRRPDGREEPRLLDFGIAKLTAMTGAAGVSSALTSTGAVLGTPYYMSPEQVFGDKLIDHRADIWSLGAIAFECLSGKRLIKGESIGQLLKVITTGAVPRLENAETGLPRDICRIVDQMLAFDRTKRASLREVLEVFRPFATLGPAATGPSFAGGTVKMDPPISSGPALGAATERTSSPFGEISRPPPSPSPFSAGEISRPPPSPAVPSSFSPVAATLFEAPVVREGQRGTPRGSPARFPVRESSPSDPIGVAPPSVLRPSEPTSSSRSSAHGRPSVSGGAPPALRIVLFAAGGLLLGLLGVWLALRLLRQHGGAPTPAPPGSLPAETRGP